MAAIIGGLIIYLIGCFLEDLGTRRQISIGVYDIINCVQLQHITDKQVVCFVVYIIGRKWGIGNA